MIQRRNATLIEAQNTRYAHKSIFAFREKILVKVKSLAFKDRISCALPRMVLCFCEYRVYSPVAGPNTRWWASDSDCPCCSEYTGRGVDGNAAWTSVGCSVIDTSDLHD